MAFPQHNSLKQIVDENSFKGDKRHLKIEMCLKEVHLTPEHVAIETLNTLLQVGLRIAVTMGCKGSAGGSSLK